MLFVFLAMSYGLRTSLYLKARLTPKLAELGEKIDGRFEFRSIHAMGMTGIILDHVRFIPNRAEIEPMTFDSVTIYPDLLGMFVGDLNASLVEIRGLNARFNLARDNSPAIEWIKELAEKSAQNGSEINVSRDGNDKHGIPRLSCRNCKVTAVFEKKHEFQVDVPFQAVEIDQREIAFSRDPMRACLIDDDTSCFGFDISRVRIGESLLISDLELSNFEMRGIKMDSLKLYGFEVARNEQRSVLYIDSGLVEGRVDDSAGFSALTGDYQFEFSKFEILHERKNERFGFGIEFREPTEATARIFGGYSVPDDKLALTFDTNKFDLARFVKDSRFSKWVRLDSFPITGHVSTIVEKRERRAWFDIDASVDDGTVFASALSRSPLSHIDGSIRTQAWVNFKNKTFALENASGKVGNIPFEMALSRLKIPDDDYLFDVSVSSKGESADFIPSIPKGFAPMLTGYQLSGAYSFKIAISYVESNIDALIMDTEFNLDEVKTIVFDPRSDFNLLKGNGFKVRVNAATVPIYIGPREPTWATFYDLPRETAYSFLASEDGKFFTHNGFDIRSIKASLIADLKADKVVRGGSTISQQVVKNLFLNHDKTASRKFQEAFLTWQMERELSKLRIFELYLNLAHWAKDTYGIRAAAEFYFQKPISQLTLRESLFLASILPNPIIFGRQYAEGKLSSSRLNKMISVGNALRQTNRITAEDWEQEQRLIREGKISDRPRPEMPQMSK
ncbi:MAG: transglycosylase domain-containing protein [Proteobacteria bacterium]|nr:transglycosylase domain-containing protein [Pseudomonadota bacterium]